MESVGQLAGGIAHDFNNLLMAILGFCELILEDQNTSHRSEFEDIKHAGKRVAALTRQLLAFSLMVEDDDGVRRLACHVLESLGYSVLCAESGGQALDLARDHRGKIDLVLTDVVMPEMSGREVERRLAEAGHAARVLFMSGYSDDAVLRHGVLETGVAFLQKPFTPLALARKVREVLDGKAV
jgi:CheY-like chemotaxis protein